MMYARRLRELREQRALSQGELAKLSGISRMTVRSLEDGNPGLPRSIRRLAEALQVEPSELRGLAEVAPSGAQS